MLKSLRLIAALPFYVLGIPLFVLCIFLLLATWILFLIGDNIRGLPFRIKGLSLNKNLKEIFNG